MKILKEIVYKLRGEYTTESLKKMGLKIGRNFNRLNGVILDPAHCWLITIGDNVTLAPRVHILAHDASTKLHLDYTKIGRVNIGNNVFIGAESVVLPNVDIGDNVIIGANSTVTKDIPSNCVYAGNPARFICTIEEYINKNQKMMDKCTTYGEEYTLRKGINNEKKEQMYNDLDGKIGYVD